MGSNSQVHIWKDPWVPNILGFIPKPRKVDMVCMPHPISSLKATHGVSWNQDPLFQLFDMLAHRSYLLKFLELCSNSLRNSNLMWTMHRSDIFSVKST